MVVVNQRVAITGIGIISPLGNDLEIFRSRLLEGVSGAKPITIFDPARLPTRIAAEVDDSKLPLRTKDRKVGFAILAAGLAMRNAEKLRDPLNEHYSEGSGGLSIGIGLELFSMPDMIRYLDGKGPADENPMEFVQTPSDICVPQICEEYHLRTPPLIHISACSASTDAIGTAFRMIRAGKRNWFLAGGSDSMINPMGVGGFCRIQAMTQRNHEPEKASRPFDRDRDGFLLGEGAAMFVIEPWNEAIARGARIYAEICGYGTSFDAHGISEPHPEGNGAVISMQRALKDSGIEPSEINYINAHGTSTPKNDPVEAKAIRRVFGDRSVTIPVSSTKSMIGHLISAAGAMETAASILCSRQGYIHPNINLENIDPDCNLNLVRNHARPAEVRYFLKNSFAFGGQNASLVVRNVLE
jgi:3-oxoacyl-[acyl-carrier-protein] synthase II